MVPVRSPCPVAIALLPPRRMPHHVAQAPASVVERSSLVVDTPAGVKRPLRPRRVSRDALAYLNLLSRRREPVSLQWLGRAWQWRLTHGPRLHDGLQAIELDWGGSRVIVRVDRGWLEQMLESTAGTPVPPSTPDPIVHAILEATIAQLCAQVEAATRRRVRIESLAEHACDPTGLECFTWEMEGDGTIHTGELWVDPIALGFLAAAMRALDEPDDATDTFDLPALPVPLRFSVGWVDLPASTLAGAEPRDVLLLDECWLREPDRLTVTVGGGLGFDCRLDGTRLVVTDPWRKVMADPEDDDIHDDDLDDDLDDEEEDEDEVDEDHEVDDDAADEPQTRSPVGKASLGDLPVRLTFDLGERVVPLDELEAITAGYTFDLGRELRRSVTIRANGRPIGEGELVDIDGRVGVSILSLRLPRSK